MRFFQSEDPKVVIVLNCPDMCEWESRTSCHATSPRNLLAKALGARIKDAHITYIIKQLEFDRAVDSITGRPIGPRVVRPITQDQAIKACQEMVLELKRIDCKQVVLVGDAWDWILRHRDELEGFEFKKIPKLENIDKEDAIEVLKVSRPINTFFLPKWMQKALKGKPKIKTLSPEESLKCIEETVELYRDGKIDHILFDIETTGFDINRDEITMFVIADSHRQVGYSLPIIVNNEVKFGYDIKPLDFEVSFIEGKKISRAIGDMLKEVPISGHNLKFDIGFLQAKDIVHIYECTVYYDTNLLGFHAHSFNLKNSTSLGILCAYLLKVSWKDMIKDYLANYPKEDRHYGNVPTRYLGEYASKDGIYNLILEEYILLELSSKMKDFNKKVMNHFTKIVSTMETEGVTIDGELLEWLDSKYQKKLEDTYNICFSLPEVQAYARSHPKVLERLQKQKDSTRLKNVYSEDELVAKIFTLGSSAQISDIVYNIFEMPVLDKHKNKKPNKKTGKVQYPADAKTLETLDKNTNNENFKRFYAAYSTWTRFKKLNSSYLQKIKNEMYGTVWHPSYNINGTVTGRLASAFHTADNNSDIKRLFKSQWEGGLLLSPDFSQLELRIVASLANEDALIEAYEGGIDVHRITASKIFNISPDEVTSKQRKIGKGLVFAIIYGSTAVGIADNIGTTVEEAEDLLNKFYEAYPKLIAWADKQKRMARKLGYIITPWGRKIPIPYLNSKSEHLRNDGERKCGNYPVQSSGSDCVVFSAVYTDQLMKEKGLKSRIMGTVHDSFEVDVYPGEILDVLTCFKEICEGKLKRDNPWIKAPIEISMELGTAWGDACIEFEIIEMSADHFKVEGSGLARDFKSMVNSLENNYAVNFEVKEETKLSDKDFLKEVLIRDDIKYEAVLEVRRND